LEKNAQITLIGDAAHPMSPFRTGSKSSTIGCWRWLELQENADPYHNGEKLESVLTEFESEMLERSAIKVKHSAEAAQFLHSEIVLMRVMIEDGA
jgi:hypothetical protein